ncbi:hypothetical protein LINPERHAP2_LOCUS4980 [Linum perenne]
MIFRFCPPCLWVWNVPNFVFGFGTFQTLKFGRGFVPSTYYIFDINVFVPSTPIVKGTALRTCLPTWAILCLLVATSLPIVTRTSGWLYFLTVWGFLSPALFPIILKVLRTAFLPKKKKYIFDINVFIIAFRRYLI